MERIRAYRDSDFAEVVALWRACELTRPYNDPATDIEFCRGSGHGEILVGEADGRIVASAMVGHDGHRGWIYYLAVDPARRKSGLGRRITEEAEAWLRARGVPKVQLLIRATNLGVRQFYQRLGYEDAPSVVMQRWLRPPKS